MENDVFGTPALRNIFNRLSDIEKTGGGCGRKCSGVVPVPGYQGILDEKAQLTPEAQEKISKEIKKFESDFTRLFVNKGMEIKSLAPTSGRPHRALQYVDRMYSGRKGNTQKGTYGK